MSDFGTGLTSWLLRTSLEGSILILIVLGTGRLLGRYLTPSWRIALWCLVGIKLVVPAFAPIPGGIGAWFSEPAVVSDGAPWRTSNRGDFDAAQWEPINPVLQVERVLPNREVSFLASPWRNRLLGGLWGLGALVFVVVIVARQRHFSAVWARQACGNDRLRLLVREIAADLGLSREIAVILAPAKSTPAVMGVWRPRLLLPADWEERFDETSFRHILAHEIQHIRYGDVLWNWIAALVNSVHWFNPLVWLAVSRFQAEREFRCDVEAVSRLGETQRIAYGRTLLRVQSEFFSAPAIAGMAPCVRNHPSLRQRIVMITKPSVRKPWLNAVYGFGLAGLIWFAFGSAQSDEGRTSEEGGRSAEKNHSPAHPEKDVPDGVNDRTRERERDGEGRREGPRDEDGKRSSEESRDGDAGREGGRNREGARDGEKSRTPGPRDGDGPPRTGPRDDPNATRTGPRDDPSAPKPERGDPAPAGPSDLLKTKEGKVFTSYDKDGSGDVTSEEMAAMRERDFSNRELRQLKDLVEELDQDGDPKSLSLEEFIQWRKLGSPMVKGRG